MPSQKEDLKSLYFGNKMRKKMPPNGQPMNTHELVSLSRKLAPMLPDSGEIVRVEKKPPRSGMQYQMGTKIFDLE